MYQDHTHASRPDDILVAYGTRKSLSFELFN